jgi:catechol 2,3-dioxygenase
MGYTPKYLGHVNIFVRNAERSRQWYADVLGLHTYDFIPGRAAFLSADLEQSHEVALIQVGDDAPLQQHEEVGVTLVGCTDHGISVGIYFHDPDGNGVEVSYELPRNQWPREERIFSAEDRMRGQFPGPWDEHLVERQTVAR